MHIPRREFLQWIALGAAGGALAGCNRHAQRFSSTLQLNQASQVPVPPKELRIVQRLTFGPTESEISFIRAKGSREFIDRQLAANAEEPLHLTAQLGGIDVLRISGAELGDLRMETVLGQLQQQALLRAIYSPNQLMERMVDFWTNHFNIFTRIKDSSFRKPADELDVVRKNALGKFPDLLKASAHSPAMLYFLDNQLSRADRPNENYAREIMELHSLGVHGGYTQKDVSEVARCFTGWTVENRFLRPRGQFRFDMDRHDRGSKRVLGHVIPAGGGKEDGDRVLEILASHPSTAKFIAQKLCAFFVGPGFSDLEHRTAKAYAQTGGDIRSMLREIFLSDELLSGPMLVKRPFDFIVSSMRTTGAQTDAGLPVQRALESMGQPLYQWPMPDGYPNTVESWTGSLLARWNFVLQFLRGEFDGTTIPWKDWTNDLDRSTSFRLAFHRDPDEVDLAQAHAADPQQFLAHCLMSPAFQWR